MRAEVRLSKYSWLCAVTVVPKPSSWKPSPKSYTHICTPKTQTLDIRRIDSPGMSQANKTDKELLRKPN